jgi:tRNA threonylcarbamoyladenosine biosynthesis protein TsaE
MRERRFRTRSVEGTLALGEKIAEMLTAGLSERPHGLVVVLRGEVGAGKTTLVKGIAAALGAAAEDEVTSPTFTIVHEYVGRSVRLFHLDLYRLETEEQIAVLGLEEMAGYDDALVLVEWGERFESVVKMSAGEIYMEHLSNDGGEGDERRLIVKLQ